MKPDIDPTGNAESRVREDDAMTSEKPAIGAVIEVALPRGLDELSVMLGQQHDVRFNCRTSFHIPASADLNLVCGECAAKWWAITVTMSDVVAAVVNDR